MRVRLYGPPRATFRYRIQWTDGVVDLLEDEDPDAEVCPDACEIVFLLRTESVADGSFFFSLLGDRPGPYAHKVGSGTTFGTVSKASGTSAPVTSLSLFPGSFSNRFGSAEDLRRQYAQLIHPSFAAAS